MELDKAVVTLDIEDFNTLKKIRNSIHRQNPKMQPMTLSEVASLCIQYYWSEENHIFQGAMKLEKKE